MRRDLAVFDESDHVLTVGQPVEVITGSLAGARGVLVGFSEQQKCQIELDCTQRGVYLVIDAEAVKQHTLDAELAILAHAGKGIEPQTIFCGRS